ncbi:MAG: response regulator [Deltaproteobacteria bacterium]|nr:response regulator [Deltaproteobacteria bacterium]
MSKKILIVDDDPDVVLFLSTVLQDQGFEALEARNGQEGFEKAASERPDLILLDLMMPEKSGISLLHDLKAEKELAKIPVIMVTGVSGETGIDLEHFFKKPSSGDSGDTAPKPDGYIEKPVDPQRLLKLVQELL